MIIYCDGSSKGNPGPGGYGVVVCDKDNFYITHHSHYEMNTTNNIQELKAVLYAMIYFGKSDETPTVYTDSNYVFLTFTQWMFNWASNDWRKADKKVPENLELIQAYYTLYKQGYRINLKKISGHSGIWGNELADALATGSVSKIRKYCPDACAQALEDLNTFKTLNQLL